MSLIAVLITLIVVGVILYVVNTYIPMAPEIKKIINIVIVLFVVIWLLKVFGLFAYLGNVKV